MTMSREGAIIKNCVGLQYCQMWGENDGIPEGKPPGPENCRRVLPKARIVGPISVFPARMRIALRMFLAEQE